MAKGSQNSASLTEICDYNGTPFENAIEQKNLFAGILQNPSKNRKQKLIIYRVV
jgi:hypothetical protein